jgi:hypothetical protein
MRLVAANNLAVFNWITTRYSVSVVAALPVVVNCMTSLRDYRGCAGHRIHNEPSATISWLTRSRSPFSSPNRVQ